ncbi:MAG: hypothetical protein KA435_13765, partial [Azonexus sp.]|nr:hypothetical protein [Azonexus sp.]MBP6204107.1 hypothetical protein [Azonexus sp.]
FSSAGAAPGETPRISWGSEFIDCVDLTAPSTPHNCRSTGGQKPESDCRSWDTEGGHYKRRRPLSSDVTKIQPGNNQKAEKTSIAATSFFMWIPFSQSFIRYEYRIDPA